MNRPLPPVQPLPTVAPRFARHTSVAGWDQDRLQRLRIMVVGAGALGNEVLKNLALAGVGQITIVDQDRVEASNLSRSVLFREEDGGCPKAEVAAARLRELAPATCVQTVVGDLHLVLGPGFVATHDLVLGCLDSIDARLGLDARCRRAGVPWWNGGLGPLSCEVTRFDPADGPCYACTVDSRARSRELQRFSCQDGRPQTYTPALQPTTVVSASLGGALLAQEALATAFPDWRDQALQPGERILLETRPHRLTRFRVPRDPRCEGHTTASAATPVPRDHEATGRQILSAAGVQIGDGVELHFGCDVVATWRCQCRKPPAVWRPLRAITSRCPHCETWPEDLSVLSSVSADHPILDIPLRQLGVPDGGELAIHSGAMGWFRLACRERQPSRSPQIPEETIR